MDITATIRAEARRVLDLIESRVPELTSRPDQIARHLAGAGLLRCCVLLRGILALEDAGLSSLGHILARQHWETWLVSFHALMRGDEAIQEIAGDDVHWKRKLSKTLALGTDYHPGWSGPEAKLNYKSLADRLPALLKKAGEPDIELNIVYGLGYSMTSLFAVHANLATIGAHIVYEDDVWRLAVNPAPPLPEPAATPLLHTIHLAQYVFKEFGLPNDEFEQMGDRVVEAVKAANQSAEASGDPSS